MIPAPRSFAMTRHSRVNALCQVSSSHSIAAGFPSPRIDDAPDRHFQCPSNVLPLHFPPVMTDQNHLSSTDATTPLPIQCPCCARRLSPTTLFPKS